VKRKLKTVILKLTFCFLIVGCLFYSKNYIFNKAIEFTNEQGFTVKQVYLDGRKYADIDKIREIININKGEPIFNVNIDEITKNLEKIDWVKEAIVDIKIPDTIQVTLVEKDPIAIWQHNKNIFLLDENGTVLPNHSDFSNLPLFTGEHIPSKIKELLALIEKNEILSKSMSSASIIRDRRWDLNLKNGLVIKLPEQNPEYALEKLTLLQKNLSLDNLKSIDMRIEGRVYLKYKNSNAPFLL